MKKFALLAASLAALGLGVFCACGGDDTPPDDGGNTPPIDQEEPETDPGVFGDTVWVSSDGKLDLEAGTFEGAQSFEITSVTGSLGDTVIACKVDGADYTLSLNENGALEMCAAGSSEVSRTFLADASAFAGAWYNEAESSSYFVISSIPDEDGYFSWRRCNLVGVTTQEPVRAVTVFEVYESGDAGMSFNVLDENYSYYFSGGYVYMTDGTALGTNQVNVYTGVFESVYIDGDENQILVDATGNTVTIDNTMIVSTSGFGLLGGGIWFEYNGEEQAIVYMNEGVFLMSESSVKALAPYDEQWLSGDETGEGAWSDSNNTFSASFADDEQIEFEGKTYPLVKSIDGGDLIYTFTVTQGNSSNDIVIRPVEGESDVLSLETNISMYSGYWFRDTAKQEFIGTFTSNAEDIIIGEDYYVDLVMHEVGEEDSHGGGPGVFAYLPELGTIAINYRPLGESGTVSLNLAMVNQLGIYWALAGANGQYAVYATYLSAEYEQTAIKEVTEAYGADENDYFTTGGTDPDTMSFDFDNGIVTLNKTNRYYFSWGYGYVRSQEEPELYLEINGENEGTESNYSYERYVLFPSADGLTANFSTVTVDLNEGTAEESDKSETFYMADSTFNELCGLEFVYSGKFVDEKFSITADGALNIPVYGDGDSATLIVVQPCDYTIVLSTSGGREIITLTYKYNGETHRIVITDRTYASLGERDFCVAGYAAVVGVYGREGEGWLTLNADGTILFADDSPAEVRSILVEDGGVTIQYRHRGETCTAVFAADKVTVSGSYFPENDGEFARLGLYTPEKFVGTYEVGGAKLVITSVVEGINEQVSLVAKVNGVTRPITYAFEGGNQVLSFSYAGPGGSATYKLTLDGDKITVSSGSASAEKSAASWTYSDFVLTSAEELDGGTLNCTVKDGAPVFTFTADGQSEGALASSYVVAVSSDGTKTLDLTFGSVVVRVTASGGAVSAEVL